MSQITDYFSKKGKFGSLLITVEYGQLMLLASSGRRKTQTCLSWLMLINDLETRFGSGDQETAVQCLFAVPSMLLASKETWRTSFDRFS